MSYIQTRSASETRYPIGAEPSLRSYLFTRMISVDLYCFKMKVIIYKEREIKLLNYSNERKYLTPVSITYSKNERSYSLELIEILTKCY